MKIGALTFFQRMHCNGAPSQSILLAAWHWKWSLTWRWHLSWSPGLSGRVGPYFMRTYRYNPGLNFRAGVNLPLLGSFNVQTQPNMHLTPNRQLCSTAASEEKMDEGKGPNPYFEGLHEGESDELRALRLALVKERDELRDTLTAVSDALDYLHGMTPQQAADVRKDAMLHRWLRDNTHPENLRKLFNGCPLASG